MVFLCCALVVTSVTGMPRGSRAAEPEPPVALRNAVKTLAAERHGITAFHRRYASDQRAPGHDQHVDVDSARVRQDGRVLAVKLYRRAVDGIAVSADELAKAQATADKTQPDDGYHLPITEDGVAEYRFGAPAACAGCDSGVVAIPFTSLKRDEDHADGVVYVDERARHLVRLVFKPSVWKQVDSGDITVTFGAALPDLWDIVSVKQRYGGHRMFVHWTFETTATHSGFRRFDSVDQARAALAAGI